MQSAADKVLIVSGGFLSVKDRSIVKALQKQIASVRASSAAWYDLNLKAVAAQNLLPLRLHLRTLALRRTPYRSTVERFFADDRIFQLPELSEVVLATLLEAEGLRWEAASFSEMLADDALRRRLLDECSCVLCSTTLLRDLSELAPLIRALRRPGKRLVAGGALATLIGGRWDGSVEVDLLAVGYGELLVPAIARWIRSGYQDLVPPPGGRLERHGGASVLFSGLPGRRDLDHLPTPDWRIAERYHGCRFELIHYESMRGCPFRCAFCSYPYLFDDQIPRYKSAVRIAEEWSRYASLGVKLINCLDSNFTVPKKRLVELCELLVESGSPVRWICYARGSDLTDLELCRLMARAGCHQVQIGAESGSDQMLAAMDKRCSVADNHAALDNCHRVGIGTLITMIIGFPGETAATVRQSYDFVRSARPDFAYANPFITRVEEVPVLGRERRERYRLRTAGGSHSSSPYWRHGTMSCEEVGYWQQWFHRRMMLERVALEGTLFYQGLFNYVRRRDRRHLLDAQRDAATRYPLLRAALGGLVSWTRRRLRLDVSRAFGDNEDEHVSGQPTT
jgi:radical SAM superfamily enzyme YgiQ (UPF0313 family)